MTITQDFQWELDGHVFGKGQLVDVTDFDPGSADVRGQDSASPDMDALLFGRDVRTPTSWGFTLKVQQRDRARALAALRPLAATWDGGGLRGEPGAVAELRYRLDGVTRLVYGRPRRFTPVLRNLLFGHISVVADFMRADLLHYAPGESTKPLTLAAAASGGYVAPFRTPLQAVGGAKRVDQVVVGGDAPTWAVVEFAGAATNPWVEVIPAPPADVVDEVAWRRRNPPWRVQLARTLPYDLTVTVDPRPWVQCALLPDGTPVPGWLTASTRMTAMRLPPGTHQATFGCDAATGPVSALIRWRDASLSL